MFEYKDSYSLGAAVVLSLLAVAIDMLLVRVGLAIFAATFFAWPNLHRRWKMTIPATLLAVCAIAAIIGLIWQLSIYGLAWRLPNTNEEAKPNLPSPALGSMAYSIFTPKIDWVARTNQASATMMIDLKNSNNFLVKFHARLRAAAGGKDSIAEFDGMVAANSVTRLIAARIDDLKPNEHPTIDDPVLSGNLDYEVEYWAAENPAIKRLTGKTCFFELTRSFSKKPPGDGSKERDNFIPITVRFQNEREQ